jgi:hypothetical protein
MAVNGGGGASGDEHPACGIDDFRAEVRPAQADRGDVYELWLGTVRECRFEGVAWATLFEPPPAAPNPITGNNRGLLTSSYTSQVVLDLSPESRWVASATWLNECGEFVSGTTLQFNLKRQQDIDAGHETSVATSLETPAPPPCEDPNTPSRLFLTFDSEVPPACDAREIDWDNEQVQSGSSVRFVFSIETPRKCLLEGNVTVSVNGPGGAGLLSPPTVEGSPTALEVRQVLGVGATPIITGTLENICGIDHVALTAALEAVGTSLTALDVPLPPCVAPNETGRLTARWVGSSDPALALPVPALPAQAASNFKLYTVKAGDTLPGIAREYGVSLGDIMVANPALSAEGFKLGMTLRIPVPATPTPTSASGRTTMCDARSVPCLTPQPGGCAFPGCNLVARLLDDTPTWLASTVGAELDPVRPGLELWRLDWRQPPERLAVPVAEFIAEASSLLDTRPTLIAVGDAQKNGVLDLVFLTADGLAFSIAIQPGPDNTHPPLGITFWEAGLPAHGEWAESTFGSALYRHVPTQ